MSFDIAKTVLIENTGSIGLPFDWAITRGDEKASMHYKFSPCEGTTVAVSQLPTATISRETTLDTAVLLSLFCDARADDDTLLPMGETDKRGWCGDAYVNRAAQGYGSLIWTRLFGKAIKEAYADVVPTTVFMKWAIKECLQHLIDDGVADKVESDAIWLDDGRLGLYADIFKGKNTDKPYQVAWGLTLEKNNQGSVASAHY